jgi:hypothetical protein
MRSENSTIATARTACRFGRNRAKSARYSRLIAMLRATAVATLVLSSRVAFGQPASPRLAFEVASIKPNKSGDFRARVGPIGDGRFRASNVPLQDPITMAYRIQDFQLSGAPPWLRAERYDVDTKAKAKARFDALTTMLQPLFEDRLQLKFHRDTKELPVYVTNRTVLDKTGFGGRYDINLNFTPGMAQFQHPPGGAALGAPPLPPIDPSGPSLFTAIQEQLSLKLESQKGPVEIIVVDHVERPSEN